MADMAAGAGGADAAGDGPGFVHLRLHSAFSLLEGALPREIDAAMRDFGLGFAPLEGDWLTHLANTDRVPLDLLQEVGLIGERAQGRGYYDRFRDRVMFHVAIHFVVA